MANVIVKTILKTIGSDKKYFLEGKIFYDDEGNCKMQERGGVYGIAVKLEEDEVESFFNKHKDERKKDLKYSDWKNIGNGYYPLYWGKDINLGFRLFEHLKASKTLGTVQLNLKQFLKGKDVIYGAVFCSNNTKNEKKLRENYPDIFKTKKLP